MSDRKIPLSPLGAAALASGMYSAGDAGSGGGGRAGVLSGDALAMAAAVNRIPWKLAEASSRLRAALSDAAGVDADLVVGPAFALAKMESDPDNAVAVLFLSAAILVEESRGGSSVFFAGGEERCLTGRLRELSATQEEIGRCADLAWRASPILMDRLASSADPVDRENAARLSALTPACTIGVWTEDGDRNRCRRPLVVESVGGDRNMDGVWLLAMERTRCQEAALAGRLAFRTGNSLASLGWDGGEIDGVDGKANGEQRAAILKVLSALRQAMPGNGGAGKRGNGGLVVITGGPGTGKTFTVAQLLRAIWKDGALKRWLVDGGRVRFTAPTGKAADRMDESIKRAFPGGPDTEDGAIRRWIATPDVCPKTIHRLLGANPHCGTFAFHENNPLDAGLVIADEASMVGVAMMDRLVRAVPEGAVLVLLGDENQLPSVEAGAVLRDLCRLDGQLVGWLEGRRPGASGDQENSEGGPEASLTLRSVGLPMPGAFRAHLVESKRQTGDEAGRRIIRSAMAINGGFVPSEGDMPFREEAAAVEFAGVERLASHRLEALCQRWGDRIQAGTGVRTRKDYGYLLSHTYEMDGEGAFGEGDGALLDDLFDLVQCRVALCATRAQTAALNGVLHRRQLAFLNGRGGNGSGEALSSRFVPGEPVLMTRNDVDRGIFNGDQGIVLRVRRKGERQRFQVVFRKSGGFKAFLLGELRDDLEPAFAMTVHKSQGSEYDEVLLVLPRSEANPLLTREIVYTAVTRARRSVVVCGDERCLRRGVERVADRNSALVERTAAAMAGLAVGRALPAGTPSRGAGGPEVSAGE